MEDTKSRGVWQLQVLGVVMSHWCRLLGSTAPTTGWFLVAPGGGGSTVAAGAFGVLNSKFRPSGEGYGQAAVLSGAGGLHAPAVVASCRWLCSGRGQVQTPT